MELFIIMIIAFFVSLVFSMIGLGGALIYTPLFYWTGLPLLVAIPMALLLNAITTISASTTYLKQKLVETGIAYPVIATAIPGALVGSYFARRVEADFLILLLSVILVLASIRMLFFSSIGFTVSMDEKGKTALGVVMGFLIGIASAMVGLGGGTFIVPLLLVMGDETKRTMATSSFIITYIALAGFVGHLSLGQQELDITMLLFAGAAAFAGAQIGSRLIFNRTSSRTIERIFAIVLLLIVIKLLYGLI